MYKLVLTMRSRASNCFELESLCGASLGKFVRRCYSSALVGKCRQIWPSRRPDTRLFFVPFCRSSLTIQYPEGGGIRDYGGGVLEGFRRGIGGV